MAKKTAKTDPKPDSSAPSLKPNSRAKTAKPTVAAKDTNVATRSRKATTVSVKDGAVAAPAPTDEEIRVRAYHRWLERGGGSGMDFDDWLDAERELRQGK